MFSKNNSRLFRGVIMDCIRNNKFKELENHKCFVLGCNEIVIPSKNKTCSFCNWKLCNNGHCGCSLSFETWKSLSIFYELLCEKNNYSKETKYALKIMIKTYFKNCLRCLE